MVNWSTSYGAAQRVGGLREAGRLMTEAEGQGLLHVTDARLLADIGNLVGPVEAAMLYGSHARGSANKHSDVDVLAVVKTNPRSLTADALTVTAYRASHLRALAARGSLFVLHLVRDGRVLYDPSGVLSGVMADYQPPTNPALLGEELSVAARGLQAATAHERAVHGPAMTKLGYYLIRTAAYDRCARKGTPEFDSRIALANLGYSKLVPCIESRRDPYTDEMLSTVMDALSVIFPDGGCSGPPGLAAAAVAAAFQRPLASDLLSAVLCDDSIDYTALTLPPA